jgi:YD repeat-containing protein
MILAVMAAAFVAASATANAAALKFHAAPGIAPVVGRYLVTLDPSVTADLAHASAEALARAYVGQLEPYASSDVRQFAIAMLPPRARALSADSRVREVVEIAHPNDALAPPPPPSSATAGLARQHLVPITRDSSSSGTYLYDGSGNIKSIGTDSSFVYDSLGRLTVAIVQGNQQSFTYDPFGNRTATVTANGAIGCVGGCDVPDTAVTAQNNNHLSAATYDDAGNVKTGFGAVYTYDGTGMVRRATVGTDIRDFVYTADDERIAVRQGVSWTWTVRDQSGKVLREFTSVETSSSPLTLTSHYWSKDYVWRSGLLLASVFPTTQDQRAPRRPTTTTSTPRVW